MAIQATLTQGNITINNAYVVIWGCMMAKGDMMTFDDQGNSTGIVHVAQYVANVRIYDSQDSRENNFPNPTAVTTINMTHTNGSDLVQEAYAAIKANGLASNSPIMSSSWTISNLTDV